VAKGRGGETTPIAGKKHRHLQTKRGRECHQFAEEGRPSSVKSFLADEKKRGEEIPLEKKIPTGICQTRKEGCYSPSAKKGEEGIFTHGPLFLRQEQFGGVTANIALKEGGIYRKRGAHG